MEIKVGMLARSKTGHDKNQIYVIMKEENEYVYLVDGKSRTIDRPKKKNRKHIQPINLIQENFINENIKRTIKLYKAGCQV